MRLTSPLFPRLSSSSSSSSSSTVGGDTSTTAMVILNTPISKPPSIIFETRWESSTYRICADGGANRLYEATKDINHTNDNNDTNNKSNDKYIPNVIRGDLDSLQPHVRDYLLPKTGSLNRILVKTRMISTRPCKKLLIDPSCVTKSLFMEHLEDDSIKKWPVFKLFTNGQIPLTIACGSIVMKRRQYPSHQAQ